MFEEVQKTRTVRRVWHIIAALGLAVTLAACGASAIDPLDIGDPDRGREIFETGGGLVSSCKGCHTLDGSARIGPSVQGISERAGDRVPDLSAVEYLRQSIVDPSAFVVEDFFDLMPKNFQSSLSEEDIDDLVAFMLTQ